MWFSGLRGAIAYALSLHLEFEMETRRVLVTTTLIIVLFTILFLGGSTMPLLKCLQSNLEPLFLILSCLNKNMNCPQVKALDVTDWEKVVQLVQGCL